VDPSLWPADNAYHFCDGGYVDNEGMVTALEWLGQLLNPGYLKQDVRRGLFDRVLLVRLMPLPRDVAPAPAARNQGWLYSVVGPIDALQHVRGTSQAERNNLVSGLFEVAHRAELPITPVEFYFESPSGASPPLSWMLTLNQQRDIEQAWNHLLQLPTGHADNPFDVVDRFF
jgi:hypothetical protein